MTEDEYIAVNNKAKLELAELIVGDLYYDNDHDDWGKRAVILTMLEGMRMRAETEFRLENEPQVEIWPKDRIPAAVKEKPKSMMTTEEAAEYLGIKSSTLNTWRCTKMERVPYVKIGGAVRYRKKDLDEYLEGQKR